jgi:hypothetical protein
MYEGMKGQEWLMARIVLIHGIAQEQKAADVLEAEWLPALAGGIRTGGFPSIADRLWRDRQSPGGIETRMAFYGHLFLRPAIQGESTEGLTDEETKVAEELAFTWLEHGVDRATRPAERAIAARELAFLQGPEWGRKRWAFAVLVGRYSRAWPD